MNNETVRESEISREFSKLHKITEVLEDIRKRFDARLEGVLSNNRLKDKDDSKNPENSSKFAQDLNGVNDRLNEVANGLDELFNRIEL